MMGTLGKRCLQTAAAVLTICALLLGSGCSDRFGTKLMMKTDSPQQVFGNFMTALRNRDYQSCRTWLAENERFEIVDNTGYSFLDELVDTSMSYLEYEFVGETEYRVPQASQRVAVTALDSAQLANAISEHFVELETAYLVENGKRSIEGDDYNQDVSNIINQAVHEFADRAGTVRQEIAVSFVFEDNAWKIKVDQNLIKAVFGDEIE